MLAYNTVLIFLIINVMSAVPYTATGVTVTARTGWPDDRGHISGSTSFSPCVSANSNGESGNPLVIMCTLTPSDDAYVDNLIPTHPFGDLPVLIVQDTPSIPKSRNYAYLKFDLPDTIPAGILLSHAKPVNATLWLYVRYIVDFFNASVAVYYVPSNDWNESALTWENMPQTETGTLATRDVTRNGTWYGWNVSSAVVHAIGSITPLSLVAAPPSNAWRNYAWFDSKEHTRTKGLTSPRLNLTFVEPYLNLLTPIPNFAIKIGDRTFRTDSSGRIGTYLPWGNYSITVPEILPRSEGVRDRFVGWSDNLTEPSRVITIGNNLTLSANYETQYRLNVNSTYASTGGSGWYFTNTMANASINPAAVLAEGIPGLLGVRHIFDHWTGDCTGSETVCNVRMNGPKTVLAVWRDDYTLTGIEVAVLIAVATYLLVFRRRKSKSRSRKRSGH